MDIEKLSRRSFLKKTTVLAAGVASMSLFSGLVNAENEYYNVKYEGCKTVLLNTVEGPFIRISPTGTYDGCFSTVACLDSNGIGYFTSFAIAMCPTYEEDPDRYLECHSYQIKSTIPAQCPQNPFVV